MGIAAMPFRKASVPVAPYGPSQGVPTERAVEQSFRRDLKVTTVRQAQ